MFATERRNEILNILTKNHRATVKDLSETLKVSEATLRADLKQMEEDGLLQRTHGGAILNEEPRVETSFSVREKTHNDEKRAIGTKASELIEDGQCIILDASSTALELAHVLKKRSIRLTVVTNGINAALELKENPGITVILIGGVVRVGSIAIEGTLGIDLLKKINVDTMFTSANGFTFDDGLTDFNVYEVELKKTMVNASSRLVALLDHSKLGRSSIASYALPKQISLIITDSKAPEHIIEKLKKTQGIDVLVAEEE